MDDVPRSTVCAHCGLCVPAWMVTPGGSEQFCCAGCRAAYELIRGCGLDRYYALRDELAPGSKSIAGSNRQFAEFDDPAFMKLHCRVCDAPAAGACVRTVDLLLEGVHCGACMWLLEKLPQLVPGVTSARLHAGRNVLTVTWDDAAVRLSRICATLAKLGYTPHAARASRDGRAASEQDRAMLARVGVAGALAGNVMLIFLALYAGAFDSMDPGHVRLFRIISTALSVLCLLWPGRVLIDGAIAAIRTRTPHLDVPISLGLVLGTAWGVYNTVRGTGELYYDSISVLIFFLLIGRYIQQKQQRWASSSVELLFSLTPQGATVITEQGEQEVSVESLLPGQTVLVRSGQSVPVDGVVVKGSSTLDRSLLTGESQPVSIEPGQEVFAGTVNVAAPLHVLVSSTGEQTRVGRLMRMVEEGSRRKGRMLLLADRAATWFLVAIVGLAVATLVIWWRVSPSVAIENAVALLVVTCPCGLGLATPMVMTIAMGRAARAGMLIKDAQTVERLADAARSRGVIALDKTGTLTDGRATVVSIEGEMHTLRLAACLVASSNHRVARAIVDAAKRAELTTQPLDLTRVRAREISGRGVIGTVGATNVIVGSEAFVRSRLGASEADGLAKGPGQGPQALSRVAIAVDGKIRTVLSLADQVRGDAREAIASLRSAGLEPIVLSGDEQAVVQSIGRSLGIADEALHAGLSPEEKLAEIESIKARRAVIMVGDGVNDAPALAAASVGIAVRGGAEASLEAADVYLRSEGVRPVVELIAGSRRVMRAIWLTIFTSVAYNVVAATLCMAGLVNPLLAAIIMPASSFTVLAVALLHPSFRPTTSRGVASTDGGVS